MQPIHTHSPFACRRPSAPSPHAALRPICAGEYCPPSSWPKAWACLDVELDTQLTTDGVVAICHDTTLARWS
ncbi:MAG: hypothetical protein R2856_10780 [Caldilineaceae bacterium]